MVQKRHKINILHLTHGLPMGGAEMTLVQYIKALGNEKYNHYVYCFGADGPVRQLIEDTGVFVKLARKRDTIKRPINFIFSIVFLFKELLSFIKDKRIQIIQSHSGEANQLCVMVGLIANVPSFPTVHTTRPFDFIENINLFDLRKYLLRFVNYFIYKAASKIIAISDDVKMVVKLKYSLSSNKILVVRNGIVLGDICDVTNQYNDEFAICEKTFKIVAVGRLVSMKCFDNLIKTVAELVKQSNCKIFVMIVGDGEERAVLQKLIHELRVENYVKLLGLRHDVLALMKFSHVFVIPSLYEGLSIAMIEAMASGLPVVASDVPGLRGHVINLKNGMLFQVKNSHHLSNCLLDLANDKELRLKLSSGARLTFAREFDMKQNIIPLDRLFRKVVQDESF